jgi:hypothetical protein
MTRSWLAMEHYRIHTIETWPEGPRKQAALAAARSTLESLRRTVSTELECVVCRATLDERRTYTNMRLAA